jgi:hypothetical protein
MLLIAGKSVIIKNRLECFLVSFIKKEGKMCNRIKIFSIQVIALVLLLSVSMASAETIILKSGQKVEGRITEQTDSYVTVEVVGVPVTYYLDQIDRIEQADARSLPKVQSGSIGKQAAGGDIKSNPEYEAIFATVKYFFENQNNPGEALKGISRDFQAIKPDGTEINYDQFSKSLADKDRSAILSTGDFQIIALKVNQNNAEAKVKFVARAKDKEDGQIKEFIINRKVFLQKELDEWKIVNIRGASSGGWLKKTPE